MKPATSNTKLISRELLCEADKSERKFLRFFFLPAALDNATEAEVDVISPASLSMPLTYYIVFSSCASPKFALFNKTKVAWLYIYFLFPPTVRGRESFNEPRSRGKFERSRAKLVLSRNNRARFIHRWECAIGKFSQASVPRTGRKFSEECFGGTEQFPWHFHIEKKGYFNSVEFNKLYHIILLILNNVYLRKYTTDLNINGAKPDWKTVRNSN